MTQWDTPRVSPAFSVEVSGCLDAMRISYFESLSATSSWMRPPFLSVEDVPLSEPRLESGEVEALDNCDEEELPRTEEALQRLLELARSVEDILGRLSGQGERRV